MYEVMVTVISKKGELKTVVKGFKTDAAAPSGSKRSGTRGRCTK